MSKKALITGITGQDGSFLAEFLLGKGYEVHGITPPFFSGKHWKNRPSVGETCSDSS